MMNRFRFRAPKCARLFATVPHRVTKNLKVQMVLVDMEVLIGSGGAPTTQKNPKTSSAPDATRSKAATAPVYDTSKEIPNLSSVQSKYADKLHKKVGTSMLNTGADGSSPVTDASLLQYAKGLDAVSDKMKSRWLLTPGMGTILDYVSQRTIRMGLIYPQSATATSKNLLAQVGDTIRFDYLMEISPENTVNKNMESISTETGLACHEIMVVSPHEKTLIAAKDKGHFTCRFRFPNSLYGQCYTDFVATGALEIQDAIEELNGIALRNSAFQYRC
jgi:hypothetical protein